jgi:hypothetical protein
VVTIARSQCKTTGRADLVDFLHAWQEGDWDHALELMNRLAALGAQPAAYPPVASTLCHIVAAELAPVIDCITPEPISNARPAQDVPITSFKPLLDIAESFLAKPNVRVGGAHLLVRHRLAES